MFISLDQNVENRYIEEYFKVKWDELSEEQQEEIYTVLCEKFKAERFQISEQLRAFGPGLDFLIHLVSVQ